MRPFLRTPRAVEPQSGLLRALWSLLGGSHGGPKHHRLGVVLVRLLASAVGKGWARPTGEQMAWVTGWQGPQTLGLSQVSQQCDQGWPSATNVLQQLGPWLQLADEFIPLAHCSLQALDGGLGGQQLLLESCNLTAGRQSGQLGWWEREGQLSPVRS